MSRTWTLVSFALLSAVVATACDGQTSHTKPPAACSSRDQCSGSTVCEFDLCLPTCENASDCGSGQWCVAGIDAGACVPRDFACDRQADCPAPLVCATDHRCRNACVVDTNCTVFKLWGRVCVDDANGVGVCASFNEAAGFDLDTPAAPGSSDDDVPPPGDDPGSYEPQPTGGSSLLPIPIGGATGSGGNAATGGKPNAGAAGTGGNTGGTATAPSVCDGTTHVYEPVTGFVDDFELESRFAGWYAFADTAAPNPPMTRAAGTAHAGAYAGHVSASGIKSPLMMGYGAGFGFGAVDLSIGNCVDVSAFEGISFYARGEAPSSELTFQVIAHESQPAQGMPVGDCASNCFQHPASVIKLTKDWKLYSIPFSSLASPAFTWTDRRILGFNWITPGPAYDVWIDDVGFYAK